MEALVDHLATELVEHPRSVSAELGQLKRRIGSGTLGGGRLDRPIVEGCVILVDAIDEAVAELAAFFAAEVKSHSGYSLRFLLDDSNEYDQCWHIAVLSAQRGATYLYLQDSTPPSNPTKPITGLPGAPFAVAVLAY